jgi:hypothetical protein
MAVDPSDASEEQLRGGSKGTMVRVADSGLAGCRDRSGVIGEGPLVVVRGVAE